MATTLNFRDIVDLPEWRSLSQTIYQSTANLSSAGLWTCEDLRCRDYASSLVYFQYASNSLGSYNIKNDAYANVNNAMGMGGTFGAGATATYCPTFSPMGTLAAGGSTTKVVISTALPASVNANQLSNRGDGVGFIIRIIGNSAGGSGKIEERRVIANTSGTTPTIYLDKPLSFTPALGDRYEFLSGSVLFLNTGASSTANIFRRYDVLTNSFSSLSTTSLIATIATNQNHLIPLDEQYVPSDRNPGEGYVVGAGTYDTSGDFSKKCLTATGSAAGTLTGQASAGDSFVVANQFRNFQVRIVEDTAIPTAVGQRRRITSHTAGASPVYTLASNWTVTPSTNAKFVIENDTDRVIGLMNGTTTIYNYFISNLGNTAATANTWDTSSWATRGGAMGANAVSYQAFGVSVNSTNEGTIRPGRIISFRGGGAYNYDVLDITGAATGSWTALSVVATAGGTTFDAFAAAGFDAHSTYNPHTQDGRYLYTYLGGSSSTQSNQRSFVRFCSNSGILERIAGPKISTGANGYNSYRGSFISVYQDGDTKLAFYTTVRPNNFTDTIQLMITR